MHHRKRQVSNHLTVTKFDKKSFLGVGVLYWSRKKNVRLNLFFLINCLNLLPLVDLKITEHVACFLVNPIPFSKLCGTENSTGAKIVDGDGEHLSYHTYDK